MVQKKSLLASLVFSSLLIGAPHIVRADACRETNGAVYDLSHEVVVTPQLQAIYDKWILDSQEYSPGFVYGAYPIPLFLERIRNADSTLVSLASIASSVYWSARRVYPEDDPKLTALGTLLEGTGSPEQLKSAMFNLYDAIKSNDQAFYFLSQNGVDSFPAPDSLPSLITNAQGSGPDAVIYQGLLLDLIAQESTDAFEPSLNNRGLEKLHRNRIRQDLLYLGNSCNDAAALAAKAPAAILHEPHLKAAYGLSSVTYGDSKNKFTVKYPGGYTFVPKFTYPSRRPLNGKRIVDAKTKYQGKYEVTDFAYGKFNNVEMHLRWFSIGSVALNLLRQYPNLSLTLHYNPDFFSKRGIKDLPAYFKAHMKAANVSSRNIRFLIDQEVSDSGESFGYPWVRDNWLSAVEPATKTVRKLRGDMSVPVPSPYTGVPISTEGGGHYPIGKYLFVSPHLWSEENPNNPSGSIDDLRQLYRETTGREPIFIDENAPYGLPNSRHVDTYMVFLPQKNGVPAIGLPDYAAGNRLMHGLSDDALRKVLRERFLIQQFTLHLERDDRPRVTTSDVNALGMPSFENFDSFARSFGELRYGLLDSPDDVESINNESNWLRTAGFPVFRFPAIFGYTQVNGFVETGTEASFSATTFGLTQLDAALADQVNRAGYKVTFIPAGKGVTEGAGLHCLTNENRIVK